MAYYLVPAAEYLRFLLAVLAGSVDKLDLMHNLATYQANPQCKNESIDIGWRVEFQ